MAVKKVLDHASSRCLASVRRRGGSLAFVQEGDRVVRLSNDDLTDISATMSSIAKEGHPINLRFVSPAAAVEMFLVSGWRTQSL